MQITQTQKPNPKQPLPSYPKHNALLPHPKQSSEHVAGHRAPGGHGRAAVPVPVPGAGEAARPPLLRRLPIAAGGAVLVTAAEEGDQAPHEDAGHEDAAMGHQAPPNTVPAAAAAPAGLDACRFQHHGTRDPRPRGGRGMSLNG